MNPEVLEQALTVAGFASAASGLALLVISVSRLFKVTRDVKSQIDIDVHRRTTSSAPRKTRVVNLHR